MGYKFEIVLQEIGPKGEPTGKVVSKSSDNANDIFFFFEKTKGKKKKHTKDTEQKIEEATSQYSSAKKGFRKRVKK